MDTITEIKEVNGIKYETYTTKSPITGWVSNIKTIVRTATHIFVDEHEFNRLVYFSKEVDGETFDICFNKWTGEYTVTTLTKSKNTINPATHDFATVKREVYGEEKERIIKA